MVAKGLAKLEGPSAGINQLREEIEDAIREKKTLVAIGKTLRLRSEMCRYLEAGGVKPEQFTTRIEALARLIEGGLDVC